MSVSISLVSGISKTFKLVQKQVVLRPNPSKRKGYDFTLETDLQTMRENFRQLVRSLPDTPGILIISGVFGSDMSMTLKVLRTDESSRFTYGTCREGSPFNWICNELLDGG